MPRTRRHATDPTDAPTPDATTPDTNPLDDSGAPDETTSPSKAAEYHRRARAATARLRDIMTFMQAHARRALDGVISDDVATFNAMTRELQTLGVPLDLTDGLLYARDGMGREFDGLTDEEASPDIAPGAYRDAERRRALRGRAHRILALVGDETPDDAHAPAQAQESPTAHAA